MATDKERKNGATSKTSEQNNISDIKTFSTFQVAKLSEPLATELTPCNGCGKIIPKENAEVDEEGKKYCMECWQKRALANQQNQTRP